MMDLKKRKIYFKKIKNMAGKLFTYLVKYTLLRKYLPVSLITVETSSYCNLRCPGCYRTYYDYPAKNKNMPLSDFKYYVDQLPRTITLVLHGYGEPTLNPELEKMVEYSSKSKKFKQITFVTNALAKKPEIYEDLFNKGITEIVISVDTFNEKEIKLMRPGTDIDLLKKNLKHILLKNPDKILINTVVSKVNIKTYLNTIKELINLGAKKISIIPFENIGDPTNTLSVDERKDVLKSYNNLKFNDVDISFEENFRKRKKPCEVPFFAPVITVDGFLTPCCRVIDKEIFNYGHLKKTTFKSLFYSKKVNKIKKSILKRKYPPFCKSCNLAV